MTREYIRAVKSRYSKQQHQSILQAYLFENRPVEEIASNFAAGEMDIQIILSSYRILLSCENKSEDLYTLKYIAERGDFPIVVGQYIDLYYYEDLAAVSPMTFFRNLKNETDEAKQQKESIDNRINEMKAVSKKKRKIAPVITRICAVLVIVALIVSIPLYFYNINIVSGDKNSDLGIYVYGIPSGSFGGQGETEPSGLGRLFTDDFDYIGQFSRGEMRGNGCFLSNSLIDYVGCVNNGKKHGLGIEFIRSEGAVVIGTRNNGKLSGTVVRISGNIMELCRYSGDENKEVLAIGNFKEINFNIKHSDYDIKTSDGQYRLGKKTELNNSTGYIVEWSGNVSDDGIFTIVFGDYKNGKLQEYISFSENGEVKYVKFDFSIVSNMEYVLCSENYAATRSDGVAHQNMSIQYNYRDESKPLLFGKYENGTVIKLGRLLASGEVTFD